MIDNPMWAQIDERMDALEASRPDIVARWRMIRSRFVLYNTSDYAYFSHFMRSSAYEKMLGQVKHGVLVLQLLGARNESAELQQNVALTIEMELSRIELKQYRRLSKDQDERRPEINMMAQSLHSKLEEMENTMCARHYSKQFEDMPVFELYFKHYEIRTIDTKKLLKHVESVNKALKLPRAAISFVNSMLRVLAPSVASTVSTSLMSIPMVGAVMIAIPVVVDAIKAWVKNKSGWTKALTTGVLIAAGIGALIAGIFPVTALGIGCALVAVGVFEKNVKPWIQTRRLIQKKETELGDNEWRIRELSVASTNGIQTAEKHVLFQLMESYCLRHTSDMTAVNQVRRLIQEGNFGNLLHDPLVKAALEEYKEKNPEKKIAGLHDFLKEGLMKRQLVLENQLKELRAKQIEKHVLLVNGILTFAGAVLLCIPTPPTIIAGAAIVFATTVIQFAINRGWPGKLVSLFKRAFMDDTQAAPTPVVPEVPRVKDGLSMHQGLRNRVVSTKKPAYQRQSSTKDVSGTMTFEKTVNLEEGLQPLLSPLPPLPAVRTKAVVPHISHDWINSSNGKQGKQKKEEQEPLLASQNTKQDKKGGK